MSGRLDPDSALLQQATIADELALSVHPLMESSAPLLIGVRHHSAMLARVVPAILESFQPETLLVELPSDLTDWIEYLADEDTIAPIAISALDPGGDLYFYPLADFSPELAAIRWAHRRGIPIVACDLSVAGKAITNEHEQIDQSAAESSSTSATVLSRLLACTGDADSGELWQRLVESPGSDAEPDSIRRAALLFGWAVRHSTPTVSPRDELREAAMRNAIRQAPKQSAAVVGSFHAAALTADQLTERQSHDEARLRDHFADGDDSQVGVSLIPYSFDQLDERSGYPAGIRDPVWHQRILESSDQEGMGLAAAELITRICRELRRAGHVAGTPDATEALRVMRDLARLRSLPTAGRGEFIEAIQSCLVHGDLMGRGRAVAKAASSVLIGDRVGAVTSKAPRCGLAVSLESDLKRLGLPGPESLSEKPAAANRSRSNYTPPDGKEFRLDVLRNPRDRARAVMFRRLCAASIPYAKRIDEVGLGHRENLIERWQVNWQQGTSATIESVSRYGVMLTQVVEAIVRTAGGASVDSDAADLPGTILRRLMIATECGLIRLTHQALAEVDQKFRNVASLSQLVDAITILTRVRAGHLVGLPHTAEAAYPPIVEVFTLPEFFVEIADLLRTCLDRLDGMEGSTDPTDVMAVVDLMNWFTSDLAKLVSLSPDGSEGDPSTSTADVGAARLRQWCRNTVRRGSDRMRGAAAGVLCMLDEWNSEEFSKLTRGWLDAASDRDGRSRLTAAIAGATQVLLPRMQNDSVWLCGIANGLSSESDERFLQRLPALRGAFQEFSPADRRRLLDAQLSILQERGSSLDDHGFDTQIGADSELVVDEVARLRQADLAGRAAVLELFGDLAGSLFADHASEANGDPQPTVQQLSTSKGDISLADRWRLVFGLPPESNHSKVTGVARSLDQLYGRGRGEGSRGGIGNRPPGTGGGTEAPQPTTAEWADDLEALFGSDVCQEVLGQAAVGGRSSALTSLDPDSVTPSVELLQQVLSLAGAMPEARTAKLRQLARRITEKLAQELAVRLQPALHGLSTPRPTRRHNRRLNLPRTIRDNLRNCHRKEDGRAAIVAQRLIFNAPARRQMDWHVTFVVDVSGSMTPSVVYSALVAAIFDALPAISVRFIAFSTEVIDFSEQVADPLSLLLEVQVGGGTNIGLGLRAARAGIKVPSRSIVVLVSDFEEGVSVGRMVDEVRSLVDAGVRCLGLASLDDSGAARFHQGYAQLIASVGMPVAAVSPDKLARWVGDQIRSGGSPGSSTALDRM